MAWFKSERRKASIAQFKNEEDGSLIAFSLFIFIAMLMFGGIAVDLMIYENKRTHIQNSTDRAVLAAANLNQTVDPKTVVQDYLAKVGVSVDRDDVQVIETGSAPVITGRQVSVAVDAETETMLMNLVGVETLQYAAASQAEEGINDVEVSLVLDISGSMRGTKLTRMQSAANDFVDGILEGASDNRVSVSLIPYATQVSAGPDLLNLITTTHNHNNSHCVNFTSADFETTAMHRIAPVNTAGNGGVGLPGPIPLSQTAHFDPWKHYRDGRSLWYPVCRNDNVDILPWSNNATTIKNRIDALTANGNTSIDVAVKWGAALLDPSMNGVLNDMIADEDITMNPMFLERPRPYTYPDVVKVMVVMTDGINTTQYELNDDEKEGWSNIYLSDLPNVDSTPDYILRVGENSWWNMNDREWVNAPSNDSDELAALRLTKLAMWSRMSMRWRAYNGFYRRTWNASDYYDQLGDLRTYSNNSQKNARLDDICDAAKAQNVVIFAIGFEVTDSSAAVMRSCASTASHFYRVEGLDINYAFSSIKNQINKLKLTQ